MKFRNKERLLFLKFFIQKQTEFFLDSKPVGISNRFRFFTQKTALHKFSASVFGLPFFIASLFMLPFDGLKSQPMDDHATPFEVEILLEQAATASSAIDAIELAKNALKIARDLRYEAGLRKSLLLLGKNEASLGHSPEALRWYVEAMNQLKGSQFSDQLAEVNAAIGDIYFREKLFERSLKFYREAAGLRRGDSETWEKMGDSFAENMEPDSAKFWFNQLIFRFKESGDLVGQIRIYQKLANAYNKFPDSLSMSSSALNYLLRMRDLVAKTGNVAAQTVLFNNIACQFTRLRDYPPAVEYFKKVELQCGYITCDKGLLFTNLGIALHNSGQSKEGLDYLLRALREMSESNLDAELPHLEHLIARTYLATGDIYNALSHNESGMKMALEQNQKGILASTYRTQAELFSMLFEFEKALDYFRLYLNLQDALRLDELMRQQRLEQQQFFLQTSEKEYQILLEQQKVKDLALDQGRLEKEKLELANRNLSLDKQRAEAEALALFRQKETSEANLRAKELEALKISAELRIAAQNLDSEKKDRQLNDLKQQEELQGLELKRAEAEQIARSEENARLRQEKDFQVEKDASFRQFVKFGGLGLGIIGLLLLAGVFITRRANRRLGAKNREIEAQKAEIDLERHESNRLLHAILPEEVANELKATGQATPRHFDSVSILFTDFKNFTQMTEKLSPGQLIDELNDCFFAFDEIAERHGLEKIKTIGDSYMAAGGAPVENLTHPLDAVRAALEMQDFLLKRNQMKTENLAWQMRIGVHTGPVVAGVVGKNKFAWDIWGDAVNIAARMESSGEAGRVNISGRTHELVKQEFLCQSRGSIAAKNKGEIGMFFVEKRR